MTDAATKLLPCPFCGSRFVGLASSPATNGAGDPLHFSVICGDCHAQSSPYATKAEQARSSWNRRDPARSAENPKG